MKLGSIEAIVAALRSANTRYLVVGGLAVAAHGFGRVTFDIDLVIQLQPDNVKRALAALAQLGYHPSAPVQAAQFADPAIREGWIRDKGMVVLQLISSQHQETPIDLFVSEPFSFDVEYDRALAGEIFAGLPMRFVAIDTLIAMKQAAGREKDIEDIRQLTLIREQGG